MAEASQIGIILSAMKQSVPAATVSRLPVYLRCLQDLPTTQETCSSEQLAGIAGVNSAQVRKDLSYLGSQGTRGVGYDVDELSRQLREALGLNTGYAVAIVGAGNLGAALGDYDGFGSWGFEVVAMFDVAASKVGEDISGHQVLPLEDLESIVRTREVSIGIIAVPAGAAQDVADRLVAAGLRSILNFAPTVLQVDPGVEVRRVDLSTELQILTFHLQQQPSV